MTVQTTIDPILLIAARLDTASAVNQSLQKVGPRAYKVGASGFCGRRQPFSFASAPPPRQEKWRNWRPCNQSKGVPESREPASWVRGLRPGCRIHAAALPDVAESTGNLAIFCETCTTISAALPALA